MNDRLIRGGIIDSERVNSLSWAAECFYRRLQSLVDDYGNYDGREAIIRTNAFKLKLNQVSESDVLSWLQVCEKAELISFYQVEGKDYLHLKDFRQKKRWMKRQYPPCPEENVPPPEEKRREIKEDEVEGAQAHPLQIYVKNNFKNVTKLRDQLTFQDCEQLVKDFDKRKIAAVLSDMENKKGLAQKYESVNLTLRKWINMSFNNTNTTKPGNVPAKITQATLKHIGASVVMKATKYAGEIIGIEEGKYRIALTNGGEIILAAWKEFFITASAPKRNMAEPTAIQNIIKEISPTK